MSITHLPCALARLARAALCIAVLSVTVLGLGAATAQAAKVTSLKPWAADNTYLVKADLDGRTRPQLEPRASIDYLRQGDWVRIACQVRGEEAYGSTLWSKVGPYYVPDAMLKTYTSGRLERAPTCTVPPTRSQIKAQADRIMNMSYWDFMRQKDARAELSAYGFNWDDNGCSAPWWSTPLTGAASHDLNSPCQQHDFGYRNYGNAKPHGLGRNETTRYWIDQRLLAELRRRCEDKYQRGTGGHDTCHFYANQFYNAVRSHGEDSFYG